MRIVNIGSLNIDYVYDVRNFVQKGQTISSEGRSTFAGGKGLNQSIALGRAGVEVCHAGMVGPEGAPLRDLLSASGVNVDWVRQTDECATGHAIIQRDREGDNCIILYGGANQRVDETFVDEVLASFSAGDWVLLQNETGSLAYTIRSAKDRGMWVALNPSPVNCALLDCPLELVDCFILNEGEAAQLTGLDASASSPAELLAAMGERFPRADTVLTIGSEGSMCLSSGETFRQPARKVEAVDTTAAGDTFTGYYLAERSRGTSVPDALRIASTASALAVSRKGAAPSIPTRAEVEELLASDEQAPAN